jgi:hypothetical protein
MLNNEKKKIGANQQGETCYFILVDDSALNVLREVFNG